MAQTRRMGRLHESHSELKRRGFRPTVYGHARRAKLQRANDGSNPAHGEAARIAQRPKAPRPPSQASSSAKAMEDRSAAPWLLEICMTLASGRDEAFRVVGFSPFELPGASAVFRTEDFACLLDVIGSQDHEALFCMRSAGQISVLNIYFLRSQFLGDL
jgi:hypothetical protein